jgi:hypothetical protein
VVGVHSVGRGLEGRMVPDDAIVGSIENKLPNRFGGGEETGEQRAQMKLGFLSNNNFMRRNFVIFKYNIHFIFIA